MGFDLWLLVLLSPRWWDGNQVSNPVQCRWLCGRSDGHHCCHVLVLKWTGGQMWTVVHYGVCKRINHVATPAHHIGL